MQFLGFKRVMPALHRAVQSGQISDVRHLLQKCPPIDEVNVEDKRTALHIAAAHGFDVIVGELLDRRANANLQDKDGNTPMHLAGAGGHLRCIQLLLGRRNADQNKHLPLQLRNAAGLTPVMLAAQSGHAAVVDMLLRSGADMHSGVLQGRVTIGHLAARGGHVQVLTVLAAHGFDMTSDTLDMNTLLHEAARNGQVAAVTWLLQAGVNPKARNAEQKSALDLARAEEHHAVVQVLLAANATPSAALTTTLKPAGAIAPADTESLRQSGNEGASMGSWQQQQQEQLQQSSVVGLQPGQLPVYPEDERYKFYPSVDKRPLT